VAILGNDMHKQQAEARRMRPFKRIALQAVEQQDKALYPLAPHGPACEVA
jgi:hypothetical protein